MYVEIRNQNLDRAIRVLKQKLVKDGIFRQLQERRFYEKPSEKKRRKKRAAIARTRRAEQELE